MKKNNENENEQAAKEIAEGVGEVIGDSGIGVDVKVTDINPDNEEVTDDGKVKQILGADGKPPYKPMLKEGQSVTMYSNNYKGEFKPAMVVVTVEFIERVGYFDEKWWCETEYGKVPVVISPEDVV